MLALREGAVQKCGHSLLLSFPERSLSNLTTMCSIYQMFTSAQHVLDQQFTSTLCPILGTWPEQTRQDIGGSLHSAHVEFKGAYVHLTWHDRDLNTHAPVLLRQHELLKLTEAEAEAAEPAKEPPVEREATLALHQPPPSGSEPACPPPAAPELEQGLLCYQCSLGPEAQTAGPSACPGVCTPAVSGATEPAPAAEASCQPKNRLKQKEPDLLDFPPRLVAEQLTYMDAVSSWAPRVGGQGRLFFCSQLPYTCCFSLMWTPRI
ncbi:ral-GDS-related protein-like [Lutra lutra]|uniref:ral-GDS-related protein-like n=1 Tax=Lutra lutra TaxID=9657 RepID=UPI001FD630B7|nr:ral-GDS-related protein-like [Lutra lutra]